MKFTPASVSGCPCGGAGIESRTQKAFAKLADPSLKTLVFEEDMGFGHRAYLGVVDEVVDLDDTCLREGQTILFARCNIVQIA